MTISFHSMIIGTILASTIAVGLASAAIYRPAAVSPRGDRLPVAVPAQKTNDFVTVEARGNGVSVLMRVPNQYFPS
jgi:hypothetical protein